MRDQLAMVRGRIEIFEHVLATYDLNAAHRSVLNRRLSLARQELESLTSTDAIPPGVRAGAVRRLVSDLRWYRLRPPRVVLRAFPDLRAI
jgi:hypothetical protein